MLFLNTWIFQSKIVKRAWVLHECLERVPEDFDAMTELLKYGLRGTDLEALAAIGRKEDSGRLFIRIHNCLLQNNITSEQHHFRLYIEAPVSACSSAIDWVASDMLC